MVPYAYATLEDVKRENCKWFDPSNRRFFGDVRYTVQRGGSGARYLVRSTYAWTDMFGASKRLHYRANGIARETLKITGLLEDQEWATLREAKAWLLKFG